MDCPSQYFNQLATRHQTIAGRTRLAFSETARILHVAPGFNILHLGAGSCNNFER